MNAVLAGRQTLPAVRNIGRKTVDFGSVELGGGQDFVARAGCSRHRDPVLVHPAERTGSQHAGRSDHRQIVTREGRLA